MWTANFIGCLYLIGPWMLRMYRLIVKITGISIRLQVYRKNKRCTYKGICFYRLADIIAVRMIYKTSALIDQSGVNITWNGHLTGCLIFKIIAETGHENLYMDR